MNGCEEYELLLSAQLDGELSAQEIRALEEHLATCPHCRALQAELALLHEAAGDLACAPPPDLTEQIMAQVRREPPPAAPQVRAPSHRRRARWLASAAVLALLVAGASFAGIFSLRTPSVAPETITVPQTIPDSRPDPAAGNAAEEAETAAPSPLEGGGASAQEPNSPAATPDPPASPSHTAPAAPSAQAADEASTDNQPPAGTEQKPVERSVMSAGAGAGVAAQSAALTQEEAQARLEAYLSAAAIPYDSLEYLGTCTGEDGYLFTVTVQDEEAATYWVSLGDGTVSPVTGLEDSPGE